MLFSLLYKSEMRKLFTCLGLAIASQAQAQTYEEARQAWKICMAAGVIALDDGISQAATIGLAVQDSCDKEHVEYIRRMPMTIDQKVDVLKAREMDALKEATILVVRNRADRRNNIR